MTMFHAIWSLYVRDWSFLCPTRFHICHHEASANRPLWKGGSKYLTWPCAYEVPKRGRQAVGTHMHPACLWCPRSNKQRFVYLPVDILSLKILWQLLKCCFLLFFWGGRTATATSLTSSDRPSTQEANWWHSTYTCPLQLCHPSQSHRKRSPDQTWDSWILRRSEKCCLSKAGWCLFFYQLKWTILTCSKMGTCAKRRIQPYPNTFHTWPGNAEV